MNIAYCEPWHLLTFVTAVSRRWDIDRLKKHTVIAVDDRDARRGEAPSWNMDAGVCGSQLDRDA